MYVGKRPLNGGKEWADNYHKDKSDAEFLKALQDPELIKKIQEDLDNLNKPFKW